ncbi:DJ-1/PfpI family protein [Actinocorallia sp. A-T 12471]|uniref:DJ-1/PfpI family protein n=1 Tax=Actinocorallia sp. A-T 12471 TaxID=3089813 RepID=UPI0029CF62E4|nr:DJ-1/PfpI family protein [Actinocorallia sp. A-T 12471]MDX6739611.1 DJ-1/PfpI family protein [Actinocorallia sp. A-T 12471]
MMTSTQDTQAKRDVWVAVYDGWADWEAGFTVAGISGAQWQREPGRFQVRTFAATSAPVTTAGGLRIIPDATLADVTPEGSAMLVLPGADAWDEPGVLDPFADLAARFVAAGVPVAAICGATAGLARAGLLDDRAHTGVVAEYLAATGYQGGAHYADTDAVTDRGVITAGPTDPVAFAREIFAELDLYEPAVLDAWFRMFARSDASAFPVLMAAG